VKTVIPFQDAKSLPHFFKRQVGATGYLRKLNENRKISRIFPNFDTTQNRPMVKRIFKFRRWRPRVSPSDIHRKSWDATKKVERGLESIVSISLRLGTLVVLIALFVFLYRTLTDQRYVIKSFSVPQHLEENGFTGAVVATRINDEVKALKELAASAKTDSLQMSGALEPALEVAVMGIGFSLESITYHLRQIMGRPNPIIRGEVVRIDSTYTLTLRMTGFEPIQREVNIALAGGEGPAVRRLMRIGGEAVMRNADPYRLALVYYREKDYESALSTIRYIIRERPGELHWAYHAWGIILEAQGKKRRSTGAVWEAKGLAWIIQEIKGKRPGLKKCTFDESVRFEKALGNPSMRRGRPIVKG